MTDIRCTGCNREFEEYEDVIAVTGGIVESGLEWPDDFAVTLLNDSPHIKTLCKECYEKASRPNRVVIEMEDGIESTCEEIREIRAERPDEVRVIVKDWIGERAMPVKQLGVVSDPEFEELERRPEEDATARKEELELYYTGMGG